MENFDMILRAQPASRIRGVIPALRIFPVSNPPHNKSVPFKTEKEPQNQEKNQEPKLDTDTPDALVANPNGNFSWIA